MAGDVNQLRAFFPRPTDIRCNSQWHTQNGVCAKIGDAPSSYCDGENDAKPWDA